MTTPTIHKCCPACKQTKDCATGFYVRSGYDHPTEPGHYLTECKACMRLRSRQASSLNPFEPRTANERYAVEYLLGKGIFAVPGKAASYAHVDVVALGCVTMEVKYARLRRRGQQQQYVFVATPLQQKRGFLGQIVMLICDDGQTRAHHLFDARDPVFYMAGRLKSGFTVVPGRAHALKHGQSRVVMTQPMLDAARDNTALIHAKYKEALSVYAAGGFTSVMVSRRDADTNALAA